MNRRFVSILTLALITLLPASAQTLDEALAKFRALEFDQSAAIFEEVVRANPRDAAARAWLAFNYQYLSRYDDAIATAREALAIEPCNALAHTVIGNGYNAGNHPDSKAALDSIWTHLRKAVECDPTAGDAWSGLWIQAMLRRDATMEQTALHNLYSSGYLTKGTLAGGRLLLRDLPRNAIVITGGDFDTYAALALQQEEKLRPDVAVVNLPLLNLDWYARQVRDRYGLKLPFNDKQLDKLLKDIEAGKGSTTLDLEMLDGWIKLWRTSKLGRPLTLAPGIDLEHLGPDRGALLRYAGWHFDFVKGQTGTSIDTAAMRRLLVDLNPSAYEGPIASPRDPSPVHATGWTTADYIAYIAILYADATGTAGRTDEARWAIDIAERFSAGSGTVGESLRETIDALKGQYGAP